MAANPEIVAKIPPILMRTLASTYELYFASQVAHWNVEGSDFVQLHGLFKDMYADAADAIDGVAERIRQLDVMIPTSLIALLQQSPVVASQDKKYVDRLYDLHEKLKEQWDSIAVVADAAEDSATVDMAGKRAGVHGKFCWMLRALTRPQN